MGQRNAPRKLGGLSAVWEYDTLFLGPSGRGVAVENLLVFLSETFPLRGDILFRENGGHRTLRFTGPTIDAFVRMDVELVFSFIDAIDGTDVDTSPVLYANTRFSNHIRHVVRLLFRPGGVLAGVGGRATAHERRLTPGDVYEADP
jgi:hypothetical protein